jgi:hypothetical protein
LNIPGEDLPKVIICSSILMLTYAKRPWWLAAATAPRKPRCFYRKKARARRMAIWREDWENRDPKAGAMKHWVRTPLDREVNEGRLRVILYKQIDEITYDSVRLTTEDGESMDDPE